MAELHPFKAVRPTRDKAHLVATRPLASYKEHILSAKLEQNPYTFIHIIHPEVNKAFKSMRPFFNYMSEVLTTDLNGISIV